MSRLSDLADVLVACRVATPAHWAEAAQIGCGDLGRTLAALAALPPPWWDGPPPDPPGLTAYQRDVIEFWAASGDGPDRLRRDLALNQFVLLDKLGRGGQGEVYRARQLNPPRFVALKTLVRDTETGRRRFEQEARSMMRARSTVWSARPGRPPGRSPPGGPPTCSPGWPRSTGSGSSTGT